MGYFLDLTTGWPRSDVVVGYTSYYKADLLSQFVVAKTHRPDSNKVVTFQSYGLISGISCITIFEL